MTQDLADTKIPSAQRLVSQPAYRAHAGPFR